ncbi:hypothetical protein GCM10027418_31550 [Mariniluteicoccus endophyticus]
MSDYDADDDYESFDLRGRDAADGPDEDVDPLDDFDDYDDLEDATDEDIDLVIGVHREDGAAVATPLAKDLANDLDELISQLRRLPADAGALGMVSLADEVFVICRVRGAKVQALLSDGYAANDWPIARDVADFLGEDAPDDEDDSEPLGDLGMLEDLGISEFEMEQICDDLDSDVDELMTRIAEKMGAGDQFRKALDAFDD